MQIKGKVILIMMALIVIVLAGDWYCKNGENKQSRNFSEVSESINLNREACLALAAEFKEPPVFVPSFSNSEQESLMTIAMANAIEMKDWDACLSMGSGVRNPADPIYPDVKYLTGLAHFEKQAFKEAALAFSSLLNYPNNPNAFRASWLWTLAMLSDGEADKSLKVLEIISAEKSHPFAAKAGALAEKIKQATGRN